MRIREKKRDYQLNKKGKIAIISARINLIIKKYICRGMAYVQEKEPESD